MLNVNINIIQQFWQLKCVLQSIELKPRNLPTMTGQKCQPVANWQLYISFPQFDVTFLTNEQQGYLHQKKPRKQCQRDIVCYCYIIQARVTQGQNFPWAQTRPWTYGKKNFRDSQVKLISKTEYKTTSQLEQNFSIPLLNQKNSSHFLIYSLILIADS